MHEPPCLHSSTDHSREVAGGEQVSSVEGEEDDGHAGEDEVVEGNVHSCLAAPVGWWHQTRDSQSRATLDLKRKKRGIKVKIQRGARDVSCIVTLTSRKDSNCLGRLQMNTKKIQLNLFALTFYVLQRGWGTLQIFGNFGTTRSNTQTMSPWHAQLHSTSRPLSYVIPFIYDSCCSTCQIVQQSQSASEAIFKRSEWSLHKVSRSANEYFINIQHTYRHTQIHTNMVTAQN